MGRLRDRLAPDQRDRDSRRTPPRSRKGDDPGVLRFDFPGGAGDESLEQISWDEWFEKFDSQGLALLYQEKKASGEGSTFFKLVNR
ncbi:hypothetical protein [Dietzia sp. WMMA184]|uniref:hypothetical protein n=1 Tax=Dietzia sp. WMMA184 TaxID=2039808 RepID=UPI001C1F8B9B|nr:hypothetical protein [Dietzia sp. WMMA184]